MNYLNKVINFPFMTHPGYTTGNILHGGTEFELYRKEIINVYELLGRVERPDFLYFVMGAAMEEIMDSDTYEKYHGWRQLFPYYIENYVRNNKDAQKLMIIISPNDSFAIRKQPIFIGKTVNIFNWEKNEEFYYSKEYNLQIYVFCTMMPCKDLIINNRKIRKLRKMSIYSGNYRELIDGMKQTKDDIQFIDMFYERLEEFVKKVEFVVAESNASFNEYTENSKFNNYYMFPQVKKVFKNLSEWIHKPNSTVKKLYGPYGSGVAVIDYTDKDMTIDKSLWH